MGKADTLKALDSSTVLVLDTETTGIRRNGDDEVLSLAIMSLDGNVLFYDTFKPERRKRWPKAEEVNGISPSMVKDKQPIAERCDEIEAVLRKAGVEILYAGEEIASGSSGVLQLGMLEVLAEWESAIDSERIRDGIQKNAQRCMANGHALYGWDIVDGFYRVNEREAAVLRRAKNMLFAGHSMADVARELKNERGKRGKPFNQDRLTKLLKRPQNAGTYSYAGVVKEGGMPAIWSQSEQDMIISILGDRHRPRRKVNSALEFPLTGKLYCASCGAPMHGTSGTSKTGATYYYYKCRKCRRTVRRDLIEDTVVDMTYEAVKTADVRRRIAETWNLCAEEQAREEKPESYFIKKELRRIDTAFARIWQAIEDGIAPPGGKERTDELKKQKVELEARLRVAEQSESFMPTLDDCLLLLDDLANETTPLEVLNNFVRFAEIDGEQIRVFFMFDDLPDDFTPDKKKAEHPCYERCSANSLVVEVNKNGFQQRGLRCESACRPRGT